MSPVRGLSLAPLERLPPRMVFGWTPRPTLAMLRLAVGRRGLRRRATRLGITRWGLIRADEAAREDAHFPSLSRCFLFSCFANAQEENHRTNSPPMPGKRKCPRTAEALITAPQIYRSGIGYLLSLHVPVSYPTAKCIPRADRYQAARKSEKTDGKIF